jgi:hypothetical protein
MRVCFLQLCDGVHVSRSARNAARYSQAQSVTVWLVNPEPLLAISRALAADETVATPTFPETILIFMRP